MNKLHRRGFTMFELLVTVAVLAILAVLIVLIINPVELQKNARDSNRFSDMKLLSGALDFLKADVRPSSWGNDKTIYISIPDPQATTPAGSTCAGMSLPTLVTSVPPWTYHCAGPNYYRNIDGTGWIPIDFRQISAGSFFPVLPVDPTNTTLGIRFYAYAVTPPSTVGKLMFVPEASKNNGRATNDGGVYSSWYEVGPDLTIAPFTP